MYSAAEASTIATSSTNMEVSGINDQQYPLNALQSTSLGSPQGVAQRRGMTKEEIRDQYLDQMLPIAVTSI